MVLDLSEKIDIVELLRKANSTASVPKIYESRTKINDLNKTK